MSDYTKETKHPVTGKWEAAHWADNALGHHNYAVIFPSEPKKKYDPSKYDLETRESAERVTHICAYNGVERYGRAKACNFCDGKAAPRTGKGSTKKKTTVTQERVTYRVSVPMKVTASGESDKLEAVVTIEIPSGRITIEKTVGSSYSNDKRNWHFAGSRNSVVRAVGEMLIAAADASEKLIRGDK